MSGVRVLAGVALAGLVLYVLASYARPDDQAPEEEGGGSILGNAYASLGNIADPIYAAIDDLQTEVQDMTLSNGQSADANARAFLEVLKLCEGTANAGGYACLYGSTPARPLTFSNFADHPKVTGEWPGAPLSDAQCAGAGLGPGCITTAAGAYQFTRPTWIALRDRLGLPDFSPASQDAAALQKLRDIGAYSKLARGDLAGAVAASRRTWASLPGANYAGQGMRTMAQVESWYSGNGGAFA